MSRPETGMDASRVVSGTLGATRLILSAPMFVILLGLACIEETDSEGSVVPEDEPNV